MKISRRQFGVTMAGFILTACDKSGRTLSIETDVLQKEYLNLVDKDSEIEVIAEGFQWSEGPTWDFNRQCLYFTDVPQNKAYRRSEKSGLEFFLSPSGVDTFEGFREPGANGLFFDKSSQGLLLCNHGRRAVVWLDLKTKERRLLASTYQGRKFNSPNDIVASGNGSVFFTDPPYGLEGLEKSPLKELKFSGVLIVSPNGNLELIDDTLTFPNGILLSPDEKTLYVSQSDRTAPIIMRYRLGSDFTVEGKDLFYDFSEHMKPDAHGLPDGMAIDRNGNIFATGPGGVFTINSQGVLLGRLSLDRARSNCAFGADGKTLFVTNQDRLLKVKTKTLGLK